MKNNAKLSTKTIAQIGMFTAVIAVLSQISFPLPSGVPVTLQTFAVALAGYVLGAKYGAYSTAIYIALGAVGAPVFAGFSGGPGFITSLSGGFIWGFLFLAFFCGLGITKSSKVIANAFGIVGLIICHVLGVLQFSLVAKTNLIAAFTAVSVPYLIKDVLSLIIAYGIALQIRRALRASNLMEERA